MGLRRALDAEAAGQLDIVQRWICFDGALVLANSAIDFAGSQQQAAMEQQGGRRGIGLPQQLFDDDDGGGMFALTIEGGSEADFEERVVGPLGECGFEFALGVFRAAGGEEGLGEMAAQGEIVGGKFNRLAEGGDGVMGVAARNGVFGLTSNNGASGVYGENNISDAARRRRRGSSSSVARRSPQARLPI